MTTTTSHREEEIAETFALIKQVHPTKLALPAIHGVTGKLIRYPMADVITESVGSKAVDAALLDALHHSRCPYVAALIQVINDEYKRMNLEALEQYDVGDTW